MAEWKLQPVWFDENTHSLHSYFTTCPESPDGKYILTFISKSSDALTGSLWIVERDKNGVQKNKILVEEELEVEDAHRQANQQWIDNGDSAIYMKYIKGTWQAIRYQLSDGKKTVLCEGRQLGFSSPISTKAALFGPPWSPGKYCDLELVDIKTEKIETLLYANEIKEIYPKQLKEFFGETALGSETISLFFPVLSPDAQKLICKLAIKDNGNFRDLNGSKREGILIYDIKQRQLLGLNSQWMHPSWHPGNRYILNKELLIDSETMIVSTIKNYPMNANSHAVFSPDGKEILLDIARAPYSQQDRHWTVALLQLGIGNLRPISMASVPGDGTSCWRKPHPHPVYSADGKRIYFNRNEGKWTRLYLLEEM